MEVYFSDIYVCLSTAKVGLGSLGNLSTEVKDKEVEKKDQLREPTPRSALGRRASGAINNKVRVCGHLSDNGVSIEGIVLMFTPWYAVPELVLSSFVLALATCMLRLPIFRTCFGSRGWILSLFSFCHDLI